MNPKKHASNDKHKGPYDGQKTSRARKSKFYDAVKKGKTKMDKTVRGGARKKLVARHKGGGKKKATGGKGGKK